MKFTPLLGASIVVALAAFAPACQSLIDNAENKLDGVAAPLKEPELPNTSKMLTCCANLSGRNETSGLVKDVCPPMSPKVTLVLDQYIAAKKFINDNKTSTAEIKTKALADLKSESQGTLEPAARCLLTETIGKLGKLLIPKDCEADSTVGALPPGKQCSDVKSAITEAK